MCKRSQVRTKKHPLNLAECQFGVVGVGSTRFLLTQIIIGQKYNSYIYIYIPLKITKIIRCPGIILNKRFLRPL